jgi:hypothetical protein
VHYHQVLVTDTPEMLSEWVATYWPTIEGYFVRDEEGHLLATDGITHSLRVLPGSYLTAAPLLWGIRVLTEQEFERDMFPSA